MRGTTTTAPPPAPHAPSPLSARPRTPLEPYLPFSPPSPAASFHLGRSGASRRRRRRIHGAPATVGPRRRQETPPRRLLVVIISSSSSGRPCIVGDDLDVSSATATPPSLPRQLASPPTPLCEPRFLPSLPCCPTVRFPTVAPPVTGRRRRSLAGKSPPPSALSLSEKRSPSGFS